MGRYCPNCYRRLSNKWYTKYSFCDEGCKQSFIKKVQKIKIPLSFEYPTKKKYQIHKRRYWVGSNA